MTATLVLATLASMIHYRNLLGIASLQESPWNRSYFSHRFTSPGPKGNQLCVGSLEGSKACSFSNNKTRHTDIHYMNDNIDSTRVAWAPSEPGLFVTREVPRRLLPTHDSITTLIIMHCMLDINIRISWLGYQESPWLSRFSLLGAPYWPEVICFNIYDW